MMINEDCKISNSNKEIKYIKNVYITTLKSICKVDIEFLAILQNVSLVPPSPLPSPRNPHRFQMIRTETV